MKRLYVNENFPYTKADNNAPKLSMRNILLGFKANLSAIRCIFIAIVWAVLITILEKLRIFLRLSTFFLLFIVID